MLKRLEKLIPFSPLLVVVLFLIVKFSVFQYKFSDTYGYFMHGTYILQGKMLYKDMFMTNLPLFPYVSALYVWLFRDNLPMFTRMCTIEAAVTAVFILLIIKKQVTSLYIQSLVLLTYLFSALILINTEYESGIVFAGMLGIIAYYLYVTKRFVLSGIFLGLTLTAKGYLIAYPFVMVLYDLVTRKLKSWSFLVPYLVTIFVVLAPSLLFVREYFFRDILFSVGRPANPNKWVLINYLFQENWVLVIFWASSLLSVKKNPLLVLVASAPALFLIFFQDSYYPYFNVALPFIILTIPQFYLYLKKKASIEVATIAISVMCLISVVMHVKTYIASYPSMAFFEPEKMVAAIEKEKPDYLYGSQDIVPLLSAMTGIPLLNGIIDTNPKIYQRGLYNTESITRDALSKRTIIVLYAYEYPQATNVHADLIATDKLIQENCKTIYKQPIIGNGILNRYFVLKCYE